MAEDTHKCMKCYKKCFESNMSYNRFPDLGMAFCWVCNSCREDMEE